MALGCSRWMIANLSAAQIRTGGKKKQWSKIICVFKERAYPHTQNAFSRVDVQGYGIEPGRRAWRTYLVQTKHVERKEALSEKVIYAFGDSRVSLSWASTWRTACTQTLNKRIQWGRNVETRGWACHVVHGTCPVLSSAKTHAAIRLDEVVKSNEACLQVFNYFV